MPVIRLRSGVMFDPLNPDPNTILIEDIAYGLAGQYRYSGHSRYTVAQHVCLVSDYLPEVFKKTGLHHDDSEGLGLLDFCTPLKHSVLGDGYRLAEKHLMNVIAEKFGFHWPKPDKVHAVDLILGKTEQRDLFGVDPGNHPVLVETIVPWSPERAEEEYLSRHRFLSQPDFFTTGDWAKAMKIDRGTALKRLEECRRKGIVERSRGWQDQGGIMRPALGWRLVTRTSEHGIGSVDPGRTDKEVVVEGDPTSGGGSGGEATLRGSAARGEGRDLPREEVAHP